MKTKIFVVVVVVSAFISTSSYAQYNPYSDGSGLATVGFGFSGWGVPVFARYEHPVADNITVGGGVSYVSKTSTYASEKWKDSYFGIAARGSYHFNELLSAPDQWDFYAGADLGYYFWNGKYKGSAGSYSYTGSGSNTFGLGGHVGARYFFKDNLAVNLEFGGGSALSGGTIGVTFIL